jgi:hypothetical protein
VIVEEMRPPKSLIIALYIFNMLVVSLLLLGFFLVLVYFPLVVFGGLVLILPFLITKKQIKKKKL